MISEHINKQIILSLLLTVNTATHGMETQEPTVSLEIVLRDPDIAWRITEHIRQNHKPNLEALRENIRALYETNTFFHDYYDQEKVMQKIITGCASPNGYYSNVYSSIIEKLGCKKVQKKIAHLCTIARTKDVPFAPEDLQDPWYFGLVPSYRERTLLYILIQTLQFEKAHTLISHAQKLDFGRSVDNYVLKLISESRHSITDEKTREELLHITERLLREKNMPADVEDQLLRHLKLTALMDAAQNNDQPFARLLLQFGANPCKGQRGYSFLKNSFEMEEGEPKDWLKNMFVMRQFEKNFSQYLLVKLHLNSGDLPKDIEQLILNNFVTQILRFK